MSEVVHACNFSDFSLPPRKKVLLDPFECPDLTFQLPNTIVVDHHKPEPTSSAALSMQIQQEVVVQKSVLRTPFFCCGADDSGYHCRSMVRG